MAYFQKNEISSNDHFVHLYDNVDDNLLAEKVNELFIAQGYSLTEGQVGNAVYERGNRFLRILLGAFIKYFKFSVSVSLGKVTVKKQTSGMSGGLIGMNQVKNEVKRIEALLQAI